MTFRYRIRTCLLWIAIFAVCLAAYKHRQYLQRWRGVHAQLQHFAAVTVDRENPGASEIHFPIKGDGRFKYDSNYAFHDYKVLLSEAEWLSNGEWA